MLNPRQHISERLSGRNLSVIWTFFAYILLLKTIIVSKLTMLCEIQLYGCQFSIFFYEFEVNNGAESREKQIPDIDRFSYLY